VRPGYLQPVELTGADDPYKLKQNRTIDRPTRRDDSGMRRVVAGPANIDGIVARVVEVPGPNGPTGHVECWKVGEGWVPKGIDVDKFIGAKPVLPELAASLFQKQS
jgi:hypothetical protein